MKSTNRNVKPVARSHRLIVREFDTETLVYDLKHNAAHCLNPLATAVWRHCDGTRTVSDLAALDLVLLEGKESMEREALVQLALVELAQNRLLDTPFEIPVADQLLSRRQAIRQLGGVAALPMVASLAQPSRSPAFTPPDPPAAAPAGAPGSRSARPARRSPGSR